MRIALAMARRGLGATAPNPSVGAVIANEATGEVISRGWTQPGGRPHAETEALAHAGEKARGATAYVTLEPCSHHGRTPPCADALIAAGVSRVVVAIEDPDPRVSGRGLDRLRAAGIAVRRGVMAADARQVTRGHVVRVTERRPVVQLKMALDVNGNVARGAAGQPVWVTGPTARAHGHLLRARTDAIVVGAATVRDDDPSLTCRLPGLEHRSPARIVLCGRSLPELETKLVQSARTTPVYICADAARADAEHLMQLERYGCRILTPAVVDGRLWLPSVMEALVGEGITRLLVEGGSRLWADFMAAHLADEIVQFRVLGDSGLENVSKSAAATLRKAMPHRHIKLADCRRLGADCLFRFIIE